MKKLSARLECISEEIPDGASFIDIGTDHGYLGISRIVSGRSPFAILTDISRKSLGKAILNAGEYCPEAVEDGLLRFVCCGGLEDIKPGSADCVVIAGMGGIEMVSILSSEPDKTKSFAKYILQPRNNAGRLRLALASAGIDIKKEKLVREGKFICEVITAEPDRNIMSGDTGCSAVMYGVDPEFTAEADYPELLVITGGDLTAEYLERKLKKEERNYSLNGQDKVTGARIARIKELAGRL